jgi:hypothetical protein
MKDVRDGEMGKKQQRVLGGGHVLVGREGL